MSQAIRSNLEHVSFQDLTIFETVSRHSSLAAAAREMGVKTPFLTKAIQRLEKALNRNLLNRSALGISLSTEGLEFLNLAKDLLGTLDRSRWMGKNKTEQLPSFVGVGGPSFLVTHLVAPTVPKVMLQENVGVRIADLQSSQIVTTNVLEYLSVIVEIESLSLPDSWQKHQLGIVEWVLCCRHGHPLNGRVSEKEVLEYPFVVQALLGPHGFRQGTDNCPASPSDRLRGTEVATAEVGIQAVLGSNQFIFIPEIQARNWIKESILKEIEVKGWPTVKKNVFLYAHQDRMKQKWVQVMTKAMEKQLRISD